MKTDEYGHMVDTVTRFFERITTKNRKENNNGTAQ